MCVGVKRRILILAILFVVLLPSVSHAQFAEENGRISGLDRWAFKTNALEWLLTIPNIGFEYDLSSSIYNRMTLGIGAKWNWNTSHNYSPSMVFDIFEVRPEFRYYWRHTQRRSGSSENQSFGGWLRDKVFTSQRKNPKPWRAYYVGAYASGGTYAMKLGKTGYQGEMYGIGLTMGCGLPLYHYNKGAIDVELGFSVGLAMTSYECFGHNPDGGYYYDLPDLSRNFRVLPYPFISEIKVAFVYRSLAIGDKYKKVDYEKKQKIMERRDARQMKRDELRLGKMQEKETGKVKKEAGDEEE